MKRMLRTLLTLVVVITAAGPILAQAAAKPNILIIWGDDVGYWNISAYNQGMMGYKTPNIDRIAREGALFTDWYGQQSCTAGRASFITGQVGFRTGMLKVGLPGAEEGLMSLEVTNSLFSSMRFAMNSSPLGSNRLRWTRLLPTSPTTAIPFHSSGNALPR